MKEFLMLKPWTWLATAAIRYSYLMILWLLLTMILKCVSWWSSQQEKQTFPSSPSVKTCFKTANLVQQRAHREGKVTGGSGERTKKTKKIQSDIIVFYYWKLFKSFFNSRKSWFEKYLFSFKFNFFNPRETWKLLICHKCSLTLSLLTLCRSYD